MKIDTEMIENFDSLSDEEKVNALLNFEFEVEKKGEDADVAKLKAALNRASADASDWKKKFREKQSESERAEAERAEKEAEKDELLKSLLREKDIANYQAKFLENGYSAELAKSSAEAMANNDFNTIFANLNAFNAAKEKEIRANVLKGTPSPVAGNGDKTITKEQFDSMGYHERVKLFEENPEVYKELNN